MIFSPCDNMMIICYLQILVVDHFLHFAKSWIFLCYLDFFAILQIVVPNNFFENVGNYCVR